MYTVHGWVIFLGWKVIGECGAGRYKTISYNHQSENWTDVVAYSYPLLALKRERRR